MKNVALWFFLTAAVSVTLGMVWGVVMSATHDHTLSAAHGHLNLVGWVTMGIFGLFYHVVPTAAEGRLAKTHFAVAFAGLITMIPGIVIALLYDNPVLAIIGSFLTLASMLIFVVTIIRSRQ